MPVTPMNLEGQRFGRLTAVRFISKRGWECRCDCGRIKIVLSSSLRAIPGTKSCGEHVEHHGRSKKKDPTFKTWQSMKERCETRTSDNYSKYGGRGIKVEFRSFADFVAHVGERPHGMTIDRIDPNGNYAPGNVRWATARTQARNRSAPPKLEDEDVPRLVTLRDGGATWKAIGEQFGISAMSAFGYYGRYKNKK